MHVIPGARLADLPQLARLGDELRRDVRVVSSILPFKVNNYVTDELIDWDRVPDDPIFRLTFPHRDMLPADVFAEAASVVASGATRSAVRQRLDVLRLRLNPHPGRQLEQNVPADDGGRIPGLQHKYRETVLVFPAQSQTCHSYCGYCFRWAQFVGIEELKQSNRDFPRALRYLQHRTEVSDVLFTGGDPMVMSTARLADYVEPLLKPDFEHIRNLRFGTKALSFWPYRFTTDADADELLRLLERCVEAGRHVAVMAHFSHPHELRTDAVVKAIGRIRSTGAVIRAQAPVVRHVNDDPRTWAVMWQELVRLGVLPYYMFVERDTGARSYFELPLVRAFQIYTEAFSSVSGIERTARGPVMSASPGKVVLDGVAEWAGRPAFVLRLLQARDPAWLGRPFFAALDELAAWFDDLRPLDGGRWPWDADPGGC